MEEMLAERVALCSWRLNRVTVFETGDIAEMQDEVLEGMRKARRNTLRFSSLHRDEALELVRGTMLEEILADEESALSETGVRIGSDPMLPLKQLENAQEQYAAVDAVSDASYDGPSPHKLPARQVVLALSEAASCALEDALDQREEGMDKDAFDARVAELDAGLFARLEGKDTYTGEEVYDSLVWLANESGIEDEEEADFGEGFTAVQGIWERLLTVTKSRLTQAQERVEKLMQKIHNKRAARTLPREGHLDKIPRYEAHLSRQMYQALHELEALQTRRMGGQAPLARIDISGIGEN
jgi:HAMP domain-containing protein